MPQNVSPSNDNKIKEYRLTTLKLDVAHDSACHLSRIRDSSCEKLGSSIAKVIIKVDSNSDPMFYNFSFRIL